MNSDNQPKYVFATWGVMPENEDAPARRPDLVGTGVGKIPRKMWERIAAANKRQKDGRICALIIRRSNAGKLRVYITVKLPEHTDTIVRTNHPYRRLIVTGITDIHFYDHPFDNEYVTMQTVGEEPVYSGVMHYYKVPGRK